MAAETPPPGPERDRRLARQVRHGWRKAEGAGDVLRDWIRGPEGKRLRRNARVVGVLKEVLTDAEMDKVEPIAIRNGVLTLGVADNVLLSELRNHRLGDLSNALIHGGTGIGRVVFKLQRQNANRPH